MPGSSAVESGVTRHALARYRQSEISFARNAGQTDRRVRYVAHTAGASFYFTTRAATLAFTRQTVAANGTGAARAEAAAQASEGLALRLRFVGANPDVELAVGDRTAGTLNYLAGPRREWRQRLPTYRELTYRELWPGIDLVFRGRGGTLKYEFHVAPGADVGAIRLAYAGARRLAVGPAGGLQVKTAFGTLEDAPPVSYQRVGGRTVPVASRYTLSDRRSNGYGFAIGAGYEGTRPLVIDPGLAYSTFLGGSALDEGFGIAVDRDGNTYVTGLTASADYPTTVGGIDPTPSRGADAFVTKLNSSGSALVYSTVLGGSKADAGAGIAVDREGSAYVTGSTDSADFPIRSDAFDPTFNGGGPFGGGDAFVSKLDPSGSDLTYSTFVGGADYDEGRGVALDAAGSALVTGFTESADYPTTAGAADETYNGGGDAFVTRLSPSGSTLAYSMFLGGTDYDPGSGIAVDRAGSAYVTGATSSADYPTTPGAVDSTAARSDAFVTKLDPAGSALAYSTLLGGSALDQGLGIAVDPDGGAYVTGQTGSADFPTTAGAFDAVWDAPSYDAFVSKLDASGQALAYSTFLGGAGPDGGQGIAVDPDGGAYVTGQTGSTDYPTTADAFAMARNGAPADAFVTKLDAAGAALAYSTYLGGTGVDEPRHRAGPPRTRLPDRTHLVSRLPDNPRGRRREPGAALIRRVRDETRNVRRRAGRSNEWSRRGGRPRRRGSRRSTSAARDEFRRAPRRPRTQAPARRQTSGAPPPVAANPPKQARVARSPPHRGRRR